MNFFDFTIIPDFRKFIPNEIQSFYPKQRKQFPFNSKFPNLMTPKKKFLRLESLVAYIQSETDGDEIFIKYNNKKVAPKDGRYIKMSSGLVALDVEIELDSNQDWVELELWDYDLFSSNDNLGKFKLLVDEVSASFSAELLRDDPSGGKYVLNWSVVERLS